MALMTRQEINNAIMANDYMDAEECFVGPGLHPNWLEAKRFVSAPVHGEGQLGRVLADIESAVRGDNEEEFLKSALVAVRMLRRQASPQGSERFGEE